MITEYYTVLQSITQYYRVLHSITQYYRVLHSIREYYRVLQIITKYYKDKSSASSWTNFWACFSQAISSLLKAEVNCIHALFWALFFCHRSLIPCFGVTQRMVTLFVRRKDSMIHYNQLFQRADEVLGSSHQAKGYSLLFKLVLHL